MVDLKADCEQCGKSIDGKGSRFCSKSCSAIWAHSNRTADEWNRPKGDRHYKWDSDPGRDRYQYMHRRLKVERGKASRCINRESIGCTSKIFEWSHIHETDPSNVDNYQELCKTCHYHYDGHFGETHPRAKLSDLQVKEIRSRYSKGGITQMELAFEYGIKQPQVSSIIRLTSRTSNLQ
jgi:hypothetical protein